MSTALQRLQLRHLHCFLAVARLGNLRRAAQSLSISQPAVTKTLADLEDILGVRLFVRGRRGAVLTTAAHAFLQHASGVVAGVNEAIESITDVAERPPLKLGVLPTLATRVLATALEAMPPGLRVHVETGRNRQLLQRLQQSELDAVLGRLAEPEQMVGLTFEHLFAEPLVAVVRHGHPLLAALRFEAADVARFRWVLPLAGTMIRHAADGVLAAHALTPTAGTVETLAVSLARQLCLGSDAVWFTPLGAASLDLHEGLLHLLPLASGTHEPVGLVLRTDPPSTAGLRAFMTAIRRSAKTQPRPGAAA